MRKILFGILVFVSLIAIALRFSVKPLTSMLNFTPRAGLRVEASREASVSIDNQEVGRTPFQGEDFIPGDHLVSLKEDKNFWQGYVKLNSGTLSVVTRELAPNQASSSGEIITLEQGKGVSIISSPDAADVEIDSKPLGKTPLYVADLDPGEHFFLISHNNFLKSSIKAMLVAGYQLNINVDLAISDVHFTQIATTPIQSSPQVIIKQTPTNFLRVRSGPSVGSNEVGKVVPGDTLVLLEELPSWYRVKLPDGKEGYISSSYAEKKNP